MIKLATTERGVSVELKGTAVELLDECFSLISSITLLMKQKFKEGFDEIPGFKEFCIEELKEIIENTLSDEQKIETAVLKVDPEELLKQYKEMQENSEDSD